MRFPRHPLLSITLLAALSTPAAGAWAQSGRGESRERPEPPARQEEPPESRAQRSSSLSDAVRRVQRETGGQVLGAERVQFDGRDINRVKVLDDRGRVRYMDDDPQRTSEAAERRRTAPSRDQPQPRARGDNPRKP